MNEATLREIYQADDYFDTPYREGVYDDQTQWWLIYPESKVYEHDGFLVIGAPGVDQIEWGYRQEEQGLWMYDPIKQEFRYLAPILAQLINGWQSGIISA